MQTLEKRHLSAVTSLFREERTLHGTQHQVLPQNSVPREKGKGGLAGWFSPTLGGSDVLEFPIRGVLDALVQGHI